MSPRPDVSEERKGQIIDAAIRVFTRLGLHQARMDDIVEESGLSKGTLYWYFNSKDDIIVAILENLFTRELESLQMPADQGLNARQRLEIYLQSTMDDITEMLRILPLTYEFYALAFRNETVRGMLTKYLNEYMKVLVPLIQQGVDEGEFRPIDSTDAAIGLGALLEGVMLLWMYDPDLVNLDHHLESSVDLFMQGLLIRA